MPLTYDFDQSPAGRPSPINWVHPHPHPHPHLHLRQSRPHLCAFESHLCPQFGIAVIWGIDKNMCGQTLMYGRPFVSLL